MSLAKRGPNFLEQDIAQRVASAPQRWTMVVTVANAGDPTADPSKAWPADRRTVEVGTLTAQQVQAAYAKSYDLRTAEAKDYPRTTTGATK